MADDDEAMWDEDVKLNIKMIWTTSCGSVPWLQAGPPDHPKSSVDEDLFQILSLPKIISDYILYL